MATAQNTTPIKRIIEEAFNQGNLAALEELYSPDHISHQPDGRSVTGQPGLRRLVTTFRTAFPDLQCTFMDETGDVDKFAAYWIMSGTHKGMFLGNPPTEKPFKALGIIFARIKNDRIIEDWTLVDLMGILQQFGIIPPLKGY